LVLSANNQHLVAHYFIGLASSITPGPSISIGIRVAAPSGAPPPLPAGGVAPLPIAPGARLEWSILDGSKFVPVEVVIDETGGLIHSGSVELQLPRSWRVGRPAGLEGTDLLRWLRLEIASGTFEQEPRLSSIKLNIVRALAVRSIFNEALEPIPSSRNRQMSLSQKPVLPDSLNIDIEEGGFAPEEIELQVPTASDDLTESGSGLQKVKVKRWRQVPSLLKYGPDDEVYTLDPLAGIVTSATEYTEQKYRRDFETCVLRATAQAAVKRVQSTLMQSIHFYLPSPSSPR
jgi:hypothetical protein